MTTAQLGQRTLLEPGTADVCVTPVICFVMVYSTNYFLNCRPGRTVAFVITRLARLAGGSSSSSVAGASGLLPSRRKEVWD